MRLLSVLVFGLAACGGDQQSNTTDPAAAKKLQAAATAMRTVSAFRFTADVVGGAQPIHVSGEFSAPDALHETVKIGSTTFELVRVGARAFRRDSPAAGWAVVPPANAAAPTDPRSAFAVLATAGTVRQEGSSYLFTLNRAAAGGLVNNSTGVTGSALLAGTRITDLSYRANSPAISVHLTYTGFNSTPPVTPPPGL